MHSVDLSSLPALNLPAYAFERREHEGRAQIYDPIRRRFVALTPEEWVRQHIVQYLIQEKQFPAGLTGIEKRLLIKGKRKRCDVVIYDRSASPLLLVECKAPHRPVKQAVFGQIATYNIALSAPYLLVTNGLEHYCCRIDLTAGQPTFLDQIPNYPDIAPA